ncbi:P27 family phage terminase small subunit [Arthrobacter sp. NPDC090010]|uniref:P27 family phage terminase small subunit n=1 Tax=Arthrobacter sp. NPDC090010 TaxID=3363942 RepID=UPI00382F7019
MSNNEVSGVEPPERVPADVAVVWREIVAANDLAGRVDRAALETFATLIARMRAARSQVDREGMVVKDGRGRVVPHPALLIERQCADAVRQWGDRFAPLVKPRRRSGYVADATAAAIVAAPHLNLKKYAGAVAVLKTLAWMIDEAQRESMDALQKAMSTTVPVYLKAAADLQLTPASIPSPKARAEASEPKPGSGKAGKVISMQERANGRTG